MEAGFHYKGERARRLLHKICMTVSFARSTPRMESTLFFLSLIIVPVPLQCHEIVQTPNEWAYNCANFSQFRFEIGIKHLGVFEPMDNRKRTTFQKIDILVILGKTLRRDFQLVLSTKNIGAPSAFVRLGFTEKFDEFRVRNDLAKAVG